MKWFLEYSWNILHVRPGPNWKKIAQLGIRIKEIDTIICCYLDINFFGHEFEHFQEMETNVYASNLLLYDNLFWLEFQLFLGRFIQLD